MVEWIFRLEEPEAERRWVGVAAREKMSVGCAEGTVWVWRYWRDWGGLAGELWGNGWGNGWVWTLPSCGLKTMGKALFKYCCYIMCAYNMSNRGDIKMVVWWVVGRPRVSHKFEVGFATDTTSPTRISQCGKYHESCLCAFNRTS